MDKAKVYLVSTDDRRQGVLRCLEFLGALDYSGKRVLIKPNFNTADKSPGSTHNDTLEQLIIALKSALPQSITIGERSGPALAEEVFKAKKIPELCEKHDVKLVNFETLSDDQWITFDREDLHWPGGFQIPKAVADADVVISTCNLKTHGFGGVFSISLKLAVGMVPKDFSKLHGSPDMRKMIAEINLAYEPDFVLLDGIDVFTDGGPMEGTRKKGNVFLLSKDRIALDAVGLAVLKNLGSNKEIMDVPIFKQEQISRAVELGLGISGPQEIEIVTADIESDAYAVKLREILNAEK